MKQRYLLTKPTRLPATNWGDLYDDISSDWQAKAERLQVRRWRKLKQQLI